MDPLGDGDELGFDDDPPPRREPFLTPETRALAGVGLGWSTRGRPMSPGLRGVAGAAVIVGVGIALLVAATALGGYLWGDEPTQQF